jgi:hypothetical protein
MSIVDSVRRPEYTGENRCTPCTIANVAISVVATGAAAGGLVAGGVAGVPVALAAALAVLAVCLAAIYLRGYLVPYTPTLTERYFPDWVLARFDKLDDPGDRGATESDLDPERALLSAGAVRPCEREDDLCLDPEFRAAWDERIRDTDDDVGAEDVLSALGLDELADGAELGRFGEAVVVERDRQEIGKWESTAALVADVAAAAELRDRYDRWDDLDGLDRSKLLRGLRIFVEECPVCRGRMSLDQDTLESCCRSYEVVAVTCEECDSRLFEERWTGGGPEAA